jgi:tRNA dimethylallyltransferase
MNKPDLPPLALIAGPTASGKSALAMALADTRPSVIINADSMQVYRDLRILTARPSPDDEARHPHRLFGTIDGSDAYSAARWAADARAAIAEAQAANRLPIVVGGTGLYIRTLLDGIAPVPAIDPAIRAEVRALSVADAHAALTRDDAEAAARFAPGDTTRIARALEVVRSTGCTLRQWQTRRSGGIAGTVRLAPLILLPPRDWLFARCDARFAAMVVEARAEVAALRARRLDPTLPVMRAIGVDAVADGDLTAGQLATRRYAKRQYTWFSRQPPVDWPRVTAQLDNQTAAQDAIRLLIERLT